MAKRKEGVYEKILACAKEEFIQKGYADASLRTIALKAGTSTNSIYVRFGDKEGLFSALVDPTKEEFIRRFIDIQERFSHFEKEQQQKSMMPYSINGIMQLLDYLYEHFSEFSLLLNSSFGTRYSDFVNELVEIETEYTCRYFTSAGYQEKNGSISKELMHIVITSFFEGLFEVIRHNMKKEEAKAYAKALSNYHHAGFAAIFYSPVNM